VGPHSGPGKMAGGAFTGHGQAACPLGSSLLPRFQGGSRRGSATVVSASTINGFFTKGFNEPDDPGESSDQWSETEDAEGTTLRIADCKMPTKKGLFRMRSYRHQGTKRVMRDGEQVLEWVDMEPVVLYKGIKGSPMKENVLVRVHDQCFTSEVMGSRRCDCREQLEMAMELVQKQGGAIIYLPQEGRGIGLANKVAAYHLQDKGLDTVDANRQLGFGDDERVYGCVPFILKDLGIESVQLMTNNPMKVRQLTELGVHVSSRHSAVVKSNPYNEGYLRAKAQRMAHVFNFDDE